MKFLYPLFFLPLVIFGQVPPYVPTSSLLAWYPFTGNANDLSGNAHNGTVIGASLTTDRYGNPLSAYVFGGSNYISVPDNPANFRPQNITISAWTCFTSTPVSTFPTAVHKIAGTGGSESATLFYYTPQSSWDGNTGGPSYFNPPVAAPSSPSVGVWRHLVYQFDDINNMQSIYMNGVLIATNSVNQSITYDASLWTFGAQFEFGSLSDVFPGKVDDIGIWSRILTPAEVMSLYCAGAGSFQTNPLSQTLTVGSNATFTAISSGTPSYQWQSDVGMGFQNLSNAGQYSGVTTSVLVVSNLTMGNNNQLFRCVNSSTPCTALSNTANLTVCTPAVLSAVNGPTTVCAGIANTFSIAPLNGAFSYTWTLPNGWSGNSSTNTISATAGSPGVIYVAATNSCGTSGNSSLSVNVGPPANPGPVSGLTVICQGPSANYSISPVQGASSYSWVLPNGWSGSSLTNTISATSGSSGVISVYAFNACGTSVASTVQVVVNSAPPSPSGINGNTVICQGTAGFYTLNTVPSATSYSWSLPNGWTGNSNTNLISATAGSSGIFYATASNSCGTSPAASLMVNVIPQPGSPAPIAGNTLICSGSSTSYSVAPVNGATSYTWSIPNGWLGNSSTNIINITATGGSGSIFVYASNMCGSSPGAMLQVNVMNVPGNPGAISGPTTMCQGTNSNFSIAPVSGATSYSWSIAGGLSGASSTNTINLSALNTNGTITVMALNFCGQSTTTSTMQIIMSGPPQTPGGINGVTQLCADSAAVFSIGPVPGATSYSWSLPAGWSGSSSSNSINAVAGLSSGNITITAINACGSSPAVFQFVAIQDCNTIGIKKHYDEAAVIEVYPIPCSDELKINLNSARPIHAILFNSLGSVVAQIKIDARVNNLSTRSFPDGVYYLRVVDGSIRSEKKLVIIH
jgi:hypothetical protein